VTAVGLRPATAADDKLCFRLHRAAMGDYVSAVWGWDQAVQRGFHERWFDPDHLQIITADGVDVGVLAVEYRPAEIHLARIEIHPDHQGRGIGSQLIRALLDEARRQDRPVVLDVLAVNRRAHALYRRLGFRDLCRHGAGNRKIRMRSSSAAVHA
jgi:ribosomal protein S18 acetylase RimI-like enzyme